MAALGALFAFSGVGCGETPARQARGSSRSTQLIVPRRFLAQRLQWHTCSQARDVKDLTCTAVRAPLDWHRPNDGRTIRLAVSRRGGDTHKHRGMLTFASGGPGVPGRLMPLEAEWASSAEVRSTFDIVGFDVRGTGASVPGARCFSAPENEVFQSIDAADRSGAKKQRIARLGQRLARACHRRTGPAQPFLSTWQAVRDLEFLRQLLRQPTLSFYGLSAGSWLGAQYLRSFPAHADRFVFDSPVDVTTDWIGLLRTQVPAFERRFRSFLGWAVRHRGDFGSTVATAYAQYADVRRRLARRPARIDGVEVTPTRLDAGVVRSLYSDSSFTQLADALAALRKSTQASHVERETAGVVFGADSDPNVDAAYFTTICNDTAGAQVRRRWAVNAKLYRRYPLLGGGWSVNPCPFWPTTAAPKAVPLRSPVQAPVLLLANAQDAAAPYAGVLRTHQRLIGSRLVTDEGSGTHGLLGIDSKSCGEEATLHFLRTGQLPPQDVVCPSRSGHRRG